MGFWEWLKNLFKKTENKPPEIDPPTPPAKPMPPPVIEGLSPEEINWNKWAARAALISSTFEGKGGDYANIVGNFDNSFLTCGLLGLTWRWGNQVKIIDSFIKKYGEKRLIELMPQTGSQYLAAFKAGEIRGANIVASWSMGSKVVREPYNSELARFWSSHEMIDLQNETYADMMGVFARKKCLEAKSYYSNPTPYFEHYAYYWDQAVLNGQSGTVSFDQANTVRIDEVMEWLRTIGGYNKTSNRANYTLWLGQIKKASTQQIDFFKLAYLRALKSKSDFQGTTMMRRGTLALGVGFVNESRREYEWFVK